MKITLQKLTLEHFKGVNSLTLKPEGKNCLIRGDNGTGKTTTQDAFLWLLFSKNGDGKADFALKTLDKTGHERHNLNHSVEGVLEIDGNPIKLKKDFFEKYTKKRGSAQAEFTGHTTKYFIDDVPVQKKEWDARINDIINENTFKLLTSPTYFNSLHWQERRNILLDVCGDVSDQDVLESMFPSVSDKGNHNDLANILNQRSLDDHKKIVASKKRTINDRLKEIPARIDELARSISDVSGYDKKRIEARIKDLEEQIQTIKDNSVLSGLRAEKAELQAKLAELNNAIHEEEANIESDHNHKIGSLDKDIRDKKDAIENANSTIKNEIYWIGHAEKEISDLREEFKTISTKEFTGDTVCPTCGQDLPADQVEAAIKKHNASRAESLSGINERGRKLQNENSTRRHMLEKLKNHGTQLESELENLKAERRQLESEKAKAVESAGKAEKKEIEKIKAQLDEIYTKINQAPNGDTSDLEEMMTAERAKIAEIDAAKKSTARIKELSDEEKTLASEYEELERQANLMDQFIVSKVELLTDKINSRFELARFKLFDTQINGGIQECCETLYEGVPYSSGLNTGAQINVGLDILRTLSDHYGIKAPVFIDHAESVTEILNPGTQTIKLAVLEDCPELEVNYDE